MKCSRTFTAKCGKRMNRILVKTVQTCTNTSLKRWINRVDRISWPAQFPDLNSPGFSLDYLRNVSINEEEFIMWWQKYEIICQHLEKNKIAQRKEFLNFHNKFLIFLLLKWLKWEWLASVPIFGRIFTPREKSWILVLHGGSWNFF